jgi:hypothetical protein
MAVHSGVDEIGLNRDGTRLAVGFDGQILVYDLACSSR